ncbi:hypothetical protein Q3G72_011805 [Acer saccharum]|nr:hypothetical protein Q3G72_011805 [Acer saccharum]
MEDQFPVDFSWVARFLGLKITSPIHHSNLLPSKDCSRKLQSEDVVLEQAITLVQEARALGDGLDRLVVRESHRKQKQVERPQGHCKNSQNTRQLEPKQKPNHQLKDTAATTQETHTSNHSTLTMPPLELCLAALPAQKTPSGNIKNIITPFEVKL